MPRDLDYIFRPRAIAVVGASRDPASFGHRVLRYLVDGGFQGLIYPVNHHAEVVHSLPCYPRLEAVPGVVDLAVILVPAAEVSAVVEQCARKGVGGIIVISAGFREIGGEGEEREQRLAAQVRRYGMRMIGPNCMGVINTAPELRMNATFAPAELRPGKIAFMSQSGAMGVAILNYIRELSLGLSMYASVGNRADVSANDLLEYWRDDAQTEAILLYMESFGNPRRFTQIARTITAKKPIIAVKAGRTATGLRAADRHTGESAENRAAHASADVTVDALFEQCGVLRVQTLEELFDLARAIVGQPLPRSTAVAVLTNAGGPGIMAADALEGLMLEVPPLDPRTVDALKELLPPEASVRNPIDMRADAGAALYQKAIALLQADPNVDVLLVIYVGFDYSEVAQVILKKSKSSKKPILVCLMGGDRDDAGLRQLQSGGVPVYSFPESACRVIRHLCDYRRYRERPQGKVKHFRSVDRDRACLQIERARREGRADLRLEELRAVAEAYGAKLTREGIAHSEDEAVELAAKVGYPVVLKVLAPKLRRKSDLGGVALDIRTEAELRSNYVLILENVTRRLPSAVVEGVVVQQMLRGGQELVLGADHDPIFGPVLRLGAGGMYGGIIQDFQFRIIPITLREATEMVRGLKIFPLLDGSRGREPIHLGSLVDLLCRASQLIEEFEEIREFEINPLIVFPRRKDFWAVDGKMRLFGPEELKTRGARFE